MVVGICVWSVGDSVFRGGGSFVHKRYEMDVYMLPL